MAICYSLFLCTARQKWVVGTLVPRDYHFCAAAANGAWHIRQTRFFLSNPGCGSLYEERLWKFLPPQTAAFSVLRHSKLLIWTSEEEREFSKQDRQFHRPVSSFLLWSCKIIIPSFRALAPSENKSYDQGGLEIHDF